MATMAKIYPDEFRDDVVKVARKGETSLTQVAKDFGIGYQTLLGWIKRADIEDGNRPGLKRSEADEVRALKRRNRTLEQENEILRRATAYFAKQLPPK
jgi:transposase